MVQLICPTCQSAVVEMQSWDGVSITPLLCMGLFSIFSQAVPSGGVGRADTIGASTAGAHRLNSRNTPTVWRPDIDALAFEPDGHDGLCMVHRRAFRTLLKSSPEPGDCAVFFHTHERAFRAAASAKIRREDVARGMNFHLTSRDVAREMEK